MKSNFRRTIILALAILLCFTGTLSSCNKSKGDKEKKVVVVKKKIIKDNSEISSDIKDDISSDIIDDYEENDDDSSLVTKKMPPLAKGPDFKPGITKQADFIKNPSLWTTPNLDGKKFSFEVQVLDYQPYMPVLVRNTINNLKIGTPDPIYCFAKAEEWANTFIFFEDNGFAKVPPTDRKDAVKRLLDYLGGISSGKPHPWKAMNGNLLYTHYAAEAGYDIIGSEVGAGIRNYQMGIAFNRGTAKQYNKPWYVDVSPWLDSVSMLDYSGASIWKTAGFESSPLEGGSLSLLQRCYYMAYMSGTARVIAEAGGCNFFYPTVDNDGNYNLSPLGEIGRRFNNFTKANPDTGIPLTPFGLMIDYYHGTNYGSAYMGRAFETFTYQPGDWLTWNILDMFFPDSWVQWDRNEKNALTNSPYGDTLDVLLQNASQDVINSYPVIILSGNLSLSSTEVDRVRAYVAQGGTLVLNTAYLNMFPEFRSNSSDLRYDIKNGNGKVIVFGPDFSHTNLSPILKELSEQYMPFSISGNVEYIINVKNGSMIVTVINNDGVIKKRSMLQTIDLKATQTVNISYKGNNSVNWVKDLRTGKALKTDKNQKVTIGPGDFAIIEFGI